MKVTLQRVIRSLNCCMGNGDCRQDCLFYPDDGCQLELLASAIEQLKMKETAEMRVLAKDTISRRRAVQIAERYGLRKGIKKDIGRARSGVADKIANEISNLPPYGKLELGPRLLTIDEIKSKYGYGWMETDGDSLTGSATTLHECSFILGAILVEGEFYTKVSPETYNKKHFYRLWSGLRPPTKELRRKTPWT